MRTRTASSFVALVSATLTVTGVTQLPSGAPPPAAADSVAAVQASADDPLDSALDAILDNHRLDNASVSVLVRDAETGEVLYQRDPDRRLNPASNAKLLTSSAAMGLLGPDSRFTTKVESNRVPRHGTLRGDLYLVGGGDPTLLQEDYAGLARQLRKDGVRQVLGDLVADDSYFDDDPLGNGWSWDDESYYYSAATSGLTLAPNTDYDSGTVIVQTSPGQHAGSPAELALVPRTNAVRLVNHLTTGPTGSDSSIDVHRAHGSDVVTVSGSIPADADMSQHWVTVPDPTTYAADVFRRALRHEGIRLKGHVTEGTAPDGANVLARHQSMTLSDLMIPFLKLSNNMHAEDLTKAMGRLESGEGTWPAGTQAIDDYLAADGVDTSSMRLRDGSGLSRLDLVSARTVTDALIAAQDEPWFDTWYDALPIAGNPERFVGGTLRNRMQDTPAADNLHGKTGSLTSVSALSGYVTNADGRKLVFSMISNNYLGSSPKDLEDAVGVTLASWSEQDGTVQQIRPKTLRSDTRYGPEGIECSWAKAC